MANMMTIAKNVKISRSQYLAGLKTENFPHIPQISGAEAAAVDGHINDVFAKHPELEPVLFNDVKKCSCGKPNAFSMLKCNNCGADLKDVPLSKVENIFSAFLFGCRTMCNGVPAKISLRRNTPDVLIYDDLLQLSPCHLNAISKKYYIPDWRWLLTSPKQGLALLQTIDEECWAAAAPFMEHPEYRKRFCRDVSPDEVHKRVLRAFNYPPSQFQLHIQYIVPPLIPFQHWMCEQKNHYHKGRSFPFEYVVAVLEKDIPYPVKNDTPVADIIAFYEEHGVSYDTHWNHHYHTLGVQATLDLANWDTDDFKYVVSDGKIHEFTVTDGTVVPGAEVSIEGLTTKTLNDGDKRVFQNYGRPYEDGKPTGSYTPEPLELKMGDGGYGIWPGWGEAKK